MSNQIKVRVNGTFTKVKDVWLKKDGVWEKSTLWLKVNGLWEKFSASEITILLRDARSGIAYIQLRNSGLELLYEENVGSNTFFQDFALDDDMDVIFSTSGVQRRNLIENESIWTRGLSRGDIAGVAIDKNYVYALPIGNGSSSGRPRGFILNKINGAIVHETANLISRDISYRAGQLRLSKDGRLAYFDNTPTPRIYVRDALDWSPIFDVAYDSSQWRCLAFDKFGKLFAGKDNGDIHVYDNAGIRTTFPNNIDFQRIDDIDIDAEGNLYIVGNRNVAKTDNNGNLIWKIMLDGAGSGAISVSPKGDIIAIARDSGADQVVLDRDGMIANNVPFGNTSSVPPIDMQFANMALYPELYK